MIKKKKKGASINIQPCHSKPMSEMLSCGRELGNQGRTCQQSELPKHARDSKVKKETLRKGEVPTCRRVQEKTIAT